jgi:CBS domain-containing protein
LRLIGDAERYLARGDIDPLRDGASYNLAGLWLDDVELMEFALLGRSDPDVSEALPVPARGGTMTGGPGISARGGDPEEAAMTKAKDIMHAGATCVGQGQSLVEAARLMRDLDVGALPICGDDDRLHGIITDRDIVLKCVAEGNDPARMTAEDLAQGKPACVDADADISDVLRLMEEHRIRRVPVVSELRLVGMISEADVARNLSESRIGHFVEMITTP